MIDGAKLSQLQGLIDNSDTDKFYNWRAWRRLSASVKRMDNYECQHCKARGRYRRGWLVHHIKHLKDRPDLALSVYDTETGERQLITLCRECHEAEHPENMKPFTTKNKALTAERWD